jgi:hypothetical protein
LKNGHKPPPAKFGRRVPRQALTTLSGILAEMGRIYRQARTKKLDHEEARSLIWMLGQIRAAAEAIELERLHGRLDDMDATLTLESHGGYIARQVSPPRIEDRRA